MIRQNTRFRLQEKLWRAATSGDCAMIRALVVNGVDINARNDAGLTAFNLATKNSHHNAAMTILAAREMQYMKGTNAAFIKKALPPFDLEEKEQAA